MHGFKFLLLAGAAFGVTGTCAMAAESDAPADSDRLGDIVVTAQKREENIQSVPISITAITTASLEANRISNAYDIGSLVPNVRFTASSTGGSAGAPIIQMRGVSTATGFPGQDRQVAFYLDGVWLGGSQGSVFDIPEIERIEVLRGPQGTLFGRNATAGALSVITRDPPGKFGVRQQFTVGNYRQLRSSTRIDTPEWGPFSATVSYTHSERRGDIRNLGAGTTWSFANSPNSGLTTLKAVKYLGDQNIESIFGALKFEPSDGFKMVYKFDRMENDYTTGGTGVLFTNPSTWNTNAGSTTAASASAAWGQALIASGQPLNAVHRPKAVNNDFTFPSRNKSQGHNLTTTIDIAPGLSAKNILSQRTSSFFFSGNFGYGGIVSNGNILSTSSGAISTTSAVTTAVPAGRPIIFGYLAMGKNKQWSVEQQFNYDSEYLTLTAGAIYLKIDSTYGSPTDVSLNIFGTSAADNNYTVRKGSATVNAATTKSLAGYAQAEIHVLPQLDIIGGLRVNNDKRKTVNTLNVGVTPYNKTKSTYSLGANFEVREGLMIYAKYGTAMLSGGNVNSFDFEPELVKSAEIGLKGDFLDRRVRFNLALWDAKYTGNQISSSAAAVYGPQYQSLGSVIATIGDLDAKGFEAELTVRPDSHITLNAGLGYTDFKLSNIRPYILTTGGVTYSPDTYHLVQRPKWTASGSAEYVSDPIFGEDTRLMVRLDGGWHGKYRQLARTPVPTAFKPYEFATPSLILNGRIAIQDIDLGGGKFEVAAWARNLLDNDKAINVNANSSTATDVRNYHTVLGNWQPARTIGLDATFRY